MTAHYSSYIEFYQRGPYARFLLEHRSAGAAPVRMFTVDQPAGDYPDPAFPELLLYVALDGAKEARFDWGAGRWRGRWRRGDLTLVPGNAATDISLAERHRFLGLCLPAAAVAEAMGASVEAVDFGHLHAAPFRDSLLAELCERLWREAESGSPHGALFADGAFDCIVAILAEHARRGEGKRAGRLGARQLDMVLDYVEARLAEDIRVEELAAICDLSRFQFSRAFAKATGMSPYRFVMQQRLDRVRTELLTTDKTLAELAFDCGFSSQQHMSTSFRKFYGSTPTAYRLENS